MKWGNRHENFSIFFTGNELFTENVNKGVRCNKPNGRTVQPTQLILMSIKAEFCALQKFHRVVFEFRFSFRVLLFSHKNAFLPKKLKF